MIALFAQTENALIYADPPYLKTTRSNANGYRYETSLKLHQTLFAALETVKGYCVVSGYRSPLYADLYEQAGWQRVDRPVLANNGGKRVESLWLSPRTREALARVVFPLFREGLI